MSPYDFWKTTDVDGERRAEEGEWIERRADELMADHDFLERVAEDDILEYGYEANARPVVELVADIITLHTVNPDTLPGSTLLTRLYQHAKGFHSHAEHAAAEQARRELDTIPFLCLFSWMLANPPGG